MSSTESPVAGGCGQSLSAVTFSIKTHTMKRDSRFEPDKMRCGWGCSGTFVVPIFPVLLRLLDVLTTGTGENRKGSRSTQPDNMSQGLVKRYSKIRNLQNGFVIWMKGPAIPNSRSDRGHLSLSRSQSFEIGSKRILVQNVFGDFLTQFLKIGFDVVLSFNLRRNPGRL